MNKWTLTLLLSALCTLPLAAQTAPGKSSLGTQVERAVTNAVSQTPKYYVPLVQLSEEEPAPGADGAEAGIFWVEIGGESTADGYEPTFFYLTSKKVVVETSDGPVGPFYEQIRPAIFNEAYRRFAADPRSANATINQTRQLLTKYYRQVEAENKTSSARPYAAADMDNPALLTRAEELFQQDRNRHSGRAQHDVRYYYNQLLREQDSGSTTSDRASFATRMEGYEPGLLYRAEELLQQDRNHHSGYPVHDLEYYYRQAENE